MQFTDIHFGEGDLGDKQTQWIMLDILEKEKPDVSVITGDVVSGYAWDGVTRPWTAV